VPEFEATTDSVSGDGVDIHTLWVCSIGARNTATFKHLRGSELRKSTRRSQPILRDVGYLGGD